MQDIELDLQQTRGQVESLEAASSIHGRLLNDAFTFLQFKWKVIY